MVEREGELVAMKAEGGEAMIDLTRQVSELRDILAKEQKSKKTGNNLWI